MIDDDTDLDEGVPERRQASPEPLGASLEERLAAQGQGSLEGFTPPKPPKKRADGRGIGIRRSATEFNKDLEEVAQLIGDNKPSWAIIQHFAKRNVTKGTVIRWINKIRQRIKDDAKDEIPILREKLMLQMRQEREKCISVGDRSNARHYFKLEMDLLGLAAPEKHDVRAVVIAPQVEEDPGEVLRKRGMTEEQLQQLIEVLGGPIRNAPPAGLIGDTSTFEEK